MFAPRRRGLQISAPLTAARVRWRLGAAILAAVAIGCSDGSSGDGSTPGPNSCAESFDSTFAAIQSVIFEKHGCTQDACHGQAQQGGLDLRAGAAYERLLEAHVVGGSVEHEARVVPGSPDRSELYRKLAAATRPGSYEIAGSPMPSGLPAIGENELEALRLWIKAGAPETGSVADPDTGSSDPVGKLLDACLPPAQPISIKPLPPPAPGEGVQLRMPSYRLEPRSEVEYCFAAYYDFTGQVPAEFLSPDGTKIRFVSQEVRQDPQSHHLVLDISGVAIGEIHDPSYGAWTCKGGERDGAECEPTDPGACPGEGICGSTPVATAGCVGFGPNSHFLTMGTQGLAGGQTSQLFEKYPDGLYNEMPVRGIWYWNSHAFNLTDEPHDMNARINFAFARDQRFPVERIPLDFRALYAAAGTPPFTTKTICADGILPRGARLIELTSHTHKRGKLFTVDLLDGTRLYESRIYSDPVYQEFDPPLVFDGADPGSRTLHYCSQFNNGVGEDGGPDPERVTRASRMPERTSCVPVACAAGRVGAACAGVADDATCDTSPGAGDGDCDACAITAGTTTENEMFIMGGWFYRE